MFLISLRSFTYVWMKLDLTDLAVRTGPNEAQDGCLKAWEHTPCLRWLSVLALFFSNASSDQGHLLRVPCSVRSGFNIQMSRNRFEVSFTLTVSPDDAIQVRIVKLGPV